MLCLLACHVRAAQAQSHHLCLSCIIPSFSSCNMLGTACTPERRGARAQVNVVPYLIDNPSIGFVQARWTFTNPEESYLTKAGPLMYPASAGCTENGVEAALVELMSHGHTQALKSGATEPRSATAGAADLPELPLQVRAVGALCFRRLLQLQRHCWWAQWQPLCVHLPAPRFPTSCLANASCPQPCPSASAVRLHPRQEQ